MKKIMLGLIIIFASTVAVKAQSTVENSPTNTDNKPSLKIEPFIGGGFVTAFGDFINYHKSFHDVAESGATIKAAIVPAMTATIGIQARYNPFEEGVLTKMSVSLGFQYMQRGFNNDFHSTYTSVNGNYTDITKYREKYQLHYLSIPIQVRWGNKLFGTLGVSFDSYINGTKLQKLTHEQSGAGAIDGGFDTHLKDKKKIEKSEIKKSNTALTIGGGWQMNNNNALVVQAALTGKVFMKYPDNFRNVAIQISYLRNIKK